MGAGATAGALDILALIVAAAALAFAITEVIWRIILFVLARKVKRTVREKLGAQEGESLTSAAKNRAKEYISHRQVKEEEERAEIAAAELPAAEDAAPAETALAEKEVLPAEDEEVIPADKRAKAGGIKEKAKEMAKEKAEELKGKAKAKAGELLVKAGKKLSGKEDKPQE